MSYRNSFRLLALIATISACAPRDTGTTDVGGNDAANDVVDGADSPDAEAAFTPGACAMDRDSPVPWARCAWGPYGEAASGAAFAPNGDLVVIGGVVRDTHYGDRVLTPAGDSDSFLARYNATGRLLQFRQFGGPYVMGAADVPQRVVVDASGNAIVAGTHGGDLDLGNGIVLGDDPTMSYKDADLFIAKFAPDGSCMWGVSAYTNGVDQIDDLVIAPDGGIVVSGWKGIGTLGSLTEAQGFVARYDADGHQVWAFGSTPTASIDLAGPVAIAPSGNVVWSGHNGTSSPIQLGAFMVRPGWFVAGLSPTGQITWASGPVGDPNAIAYLTDGSIEMVGSSDSAVDLGGGVTLAITPGTRTSFIAHFGADGHAMSIAQTDMQLDPHSILFVASSNTTRILPDGSVVLAMAVTNSSSFGSHAITVASPSLVLARYIGGTAQSVSGPWTQIITNGIAIGTDNQVAVLGAYEYDTTFESDSLPVTPSPINGVRFSDLLVGVTRLAP